MDRKPEDEVMDVQDEVTAYAQADFSQVNQTFVESLIELARKSGIADGHDVTAIDLGTGPADIPMRLVRALLPRASVSWRIVAVDASQPMLDCAARAIRQAGLANHIELVHADAKDTRLPAQSFDVIFSNSILHHLNEPLEFWLEIRRLAKPGAIVFLRDLARPASPQVARSIIDRYAASETPMLQQEFYRSLLAAYTIDEVSVQIASAGLDTLQVWMVSDRHLEVSGKIIRR